MSPRDLDRLNDAILLDETGTRWRMAVYTRQRHRPVRRQLPPTARQLRRIVAKARRAGGAR